jgi:hypothetical protein
MTALPLKGDILGVALALHLWAAALPTGDGSLALV